MDIIGLTRRRIDSDPWTVLAAGASSMAPGCECDLRCVGHHTLQYTLIGLIPGAWR